MAEDVSMVTLPVETTITSLSKVMGLDDNNATVLFGLENLRTNYKGQLKTTDAAPPTPLLNDSYELIGTGAGTSPAGTYTNLLGTGGTAIAIPAPATGYAVFAAKAVWNGTYWVPLWQTVQIPDNSGKIVAWSATTYTAGDQVNYLGKDWTASADTLSTDIPGTSDLWIERLPGYEATTDLFDTNIAASAQLSTTQHVDSNYDTSGNLISAAGKIVTDIVPVTVPSGGLRITIAGVSNASSSGLYLKTFDSALSQISATYLNSLSVEYEFYNGAYTYLITDTTVKNIALLANTGSFVTNAAFAIWEGPFVRQSAKYFSNYTKSFAYDSQNGAITGNDLLQNPQANLARLLPSGSFYDNSLASPFGYAISSPGSTLFTGTEKIACNNGDVFIFSVNSVGTNGTIGYYVNSSGNYVNYINASSYTTDGDGNHTFTVPSTSGIAYFYLFFKESEVDLSTLIIVKASRLYQPLIKSSFIPNIKGISSGLAADFYNRGAKTKTDVTPLAPAYLFAGQSNANGRIELTDNLPSWWTSNGNKITDVQMQHADTLNWHDYNTTDYNTYGGISYWSYDMLLLKYIIDNRKTGNSANKIYAVKDAVDGTSINNLAGSEGGGRWLAEFELLGSTTALLSNFESRINLALNSSNGSLFNVKALFWHQGESDRNAPQTYYQNLKNLIYYLRGVLKNPQLAVVLGGINTSSGEYTIGVEEAKQALAAEDNFIFYAAVSNGSSYLKSDSLHFNSVGAQDLTDSITAIMNANKTIFGLL